MLLSFLIYAIPHLPASKVQRNVVYLRDVVTSLNDGLFKTSKRGTVEEVANALATGQSTASTNFGCKKYIKVSLAGSCLECSISSRSILLSGWAIWKRILQRRSCEHKKYEKND